VEIPVTDKMISAVQTAIQAFADVKVEKEVARLSFEFPDTSEQGADPEIQVRALNYAVAAIRHASKFRALAMDQLCTPQHLQWNPVRPCYSPLCCSDCPN